MATTESPEIEPWPLGDLLKKARERRKLGIAGAAKRAGMSQGKWHQIERGVRAVAGGYKPFRPKPDDIVTAARAVNADPREALRAAGYDPKIDAPDLEATPTITVSELAAKLKRMTPGQRSAVLGMINSILDPDLGAEQDHGILYDVEIDDPTD
ncbi:helix-turn-helix domain-containing protein [Saccharopolyspora pogona]|uniref:helix-turn-helix domain-containing protein n=1 Tax=Saccharopolyspora pogona TaxID=333966 RepID=UPI001688231C|nr:helix-turn-helix transcriptional regulator [Saccharopolyspora pogona]